jgi:hypothetical protein
LRKYYKDLGFQLNNMKLNKVIVFQDSYIKTPNIKFSRTLKKTLRMTSYETHFF